MDFDYSGCVSVAEFITVRFQPDRLRRAALSVPVSVAEFITVRFQPFPSCLCECAI